MSSETGNRGNDQSVQTENAQCKVENSWACKGEKQYHPDGDWHQFREDSGLFHGKRPGRRSGLNFCCRDTRDSDWSNDPTNTTF